MKIKITYPEKGESWDNPKKWVEENIEVKDDLVFVVAKQWGNKIGLFVHFLKKGEGATYNHFTTQKIIFS